MLKNFTATCAVALLGVWTTPSSAEFLSHTFSRHDTSKPLTYVEKAMPNVERAVMPEVVNPEVGEAAIPDISKLAPVRALEDRKLWMSPSLDLDFYVEETKTHRSKVGIIPGVGYGLRWNPSWWRSWVATSTIDIHSKSFLNFDVYVQGNLVDETEAFPGNDYFDIDVLPTFSLFDWISVGYGYRWKRSQHSGLDNQNTPIFSFGLRKAL